MEGELIYVSIITSLFGILGLLLINRNWFKKEMFKLERQNLQQKNKIQIEKMRRELGLDNKPLREPQIAQEGGGLGGILPLLRNIPPEQLASLIERFSVGGDSEGEVVGGLDGLMDFVAKNPEIVKGFLQGVTKPKESTSSPEENGQFLG